MENELNRSFTVTDNGLTIHNGFEVISENYMFFFLNEIRKEFPNCRLFELRSLKNLVREWQAHNLLFEMGIFEKHAIDVDFEAEQKWYCRILYFVLSKIYKFFGNK